LSGKIYPGEKIALRLEKGVDLLCSGLEEVPCGLPLCCFWLDTWRARACGLVEPGLARTDPGETVYAKSLHLPVTRATATQTDRA